MFRRLLLGRRQSAIIEPVLGNDGYRVFSREFDEELSAKELLKRTGLGQSAYDAYAQFRRTVAPQITEVTARALQVADQLKARSASSPHDAVATLLIDHSGSMRGANMQLAALTALGFETLMRALDMKFEILGFTTVGWKGEPVRKRWLDDCRLIDKRSAPGRLCALRHIVYSAFVDSSTTRLDAMFAEPLLKENVDGEALQWAAGRLAECAATSRTLLLISDGAPVDDSTLASNHPSFLQDHCREQIKAIAQGSDITLGAIGVNFDMSGSVSGAPKIATFADVPDAALPYLRDLISR